MFRFFFLLPCVKYLCACVVALTHTHTHTHTHNSAENPIGMRIGGAARARQRECRGGGAQRDAWRRNALVHIIYARDINRAIPRQQQQHFVEFLCESFNLTHYCPGRVFQEVRYICMRNVTRERSSRCRGCKVIRGENKTIFLQFFFHLLQVVHPIYTSNGG
uniref:Secreted protein n=1 Tax=Trichogramma kaykai TaxID=54128 RepID=A0ABD2WX86_9HYME